MTPPEYVLRGLRMSLGVATCLGIGYMAINYQFIGETPHRNISLSPFPPACLSVIAGSPFAMSQPHGIRNVIHRLTFVADKGKWGDEMSDLVGNAARSGAITCVVSPHVAHIRKQSAHEF